MTKILLLFKECAITTFDICKTLFKLIIPISIIMKIITELGLVSYIGTFLSPVMSLVGLPGSYGIVWAAALCTNVYGSMLAFASIFVIDPITKSQVTVLAMLLLFAHSIPLENSVGKKSGIKISVSIITRLGAGILFGMFFNFLFSILNLYNQPAVVLWISENTGTTIIGWIFGELKNYLMIIAIIFSINFALTILEKSGLLDFLVKLLKPVLKYIGIGEKPIPLTIIGVFLGYAYMGGFFIREARKNTFMYKELFYTITFVSLYHGIIEDHMLMIAIGASAFQIFIMRVIVTYIVCMIIYLFTRNMDINKFVKLFFTKKWVKRFKERSSRQI